MIKHSALRIFTFFAIKGASSCLKGLSHEIFGPVFWAVWMYLGLNVNRLWFLNFIYSLLILDN